MWSWDFEVLAFMVNLANPSSHCELATLLVADGGIVAPTTLPELDSSGKPLFMLDIWTVHMAETKIRSHTLYTTSMYSFAIWYLSSCSICVSNPKFLAALSKYDVTIFQATRPSAK